MHRPPSPRNTVALPRASRPGRVPHLTSSTTDSRPCRLPRRVVRRHERPRVEAPTDNARQDQTPLRDPRLHHCHEYAADGKQRPSRSVLGTDVEVRSFIRPELCVAARPAASAAGGRLRPACPDGCPGHGRARIDTDRFDEGPKACRQADGAREQRRRRGPNQPPGPHGGELADQARGGRRPTPNGLPPHQPRPPVIGARPAIESPPESRAAGRPHPAWRRAPQAPLKQQQAQRGQQPARPTPLPRPSARQPAQPTPPVRLPTQHAPLGRLPTHDAPLKQLRTQHARQPARHAPQHARQPAQHAPRHAQHAQPPIQHAQQPTQRAPHKQLSGRRARSGRESFRSTHGAQGRARCPRWRSRRSRWAQPAGEIARHSQRHARPAEERAQLARAAGMGVRPAGPHTEQRRPVAWKRGRAAGRGVRPAGPHTEQRRPSSWKRGRAAGKQARPAEQHGEEANGPPTPNRHAQPGAIPH